MWRFDKNSCKIYNIYERITYMNTIICLKTDKQDKRQAQKLAAKMGLTLTDVLNIIIRIFIRVKAVPSDFHRDGSKSSKDLIIAIEEAGKEYANEKIQKTDSIDGFIKHLKQIALQNN
jgi:addiction module RelB/DinJ family antitoxin